MGPRCSRSLNLRPVRATLAVRECRAHGPSCPPHGAARPRPAGGLPASASANPIAAGEGQSCTINGAGAALCWGSRSEGALGDGLTRPDSFDPVQVSGLTSGVTHIVSSQQGGGASTAVCAIVTGAAKCWGSNYAGKLGNGTTTGSAVPTDVVGLTSGVTDLSTSAGRSCAVHNGAAKCWGGAYLGDGTNKDSTVPVQVSGLTSNVTHVSNGWRSTCAIQAGVVLCWGGGEHGSMGSPGGGSGSPRAITVTGPGAATALAAGPRLGLRDLPRRGPLLGLEHLRPARRRDHRLEHHAGQRRRPGLGRHRDQPQLVHGLRDQERPAVLLGRRRQREARQRQRRALERAGPGRRA